jgi:nicotinamide phosphoribosyltransferase
MTNENPQWRPGDHSVLLDVDSYKGSHFLQYPPGTEYVSSYIEARGGKFDDMVFFGLQMYLKRYLSRPITQAEINYAEALWTDHGVPFNREGWEHILREHNGYLPLRIEAVKEGTVLPVQNAIVQIINTDSKVPWLTSFMETALLRAVWYPTTVATLSWTVKQIIRRYLQKTCENPEAELPFKLHDFGARGVSSHESAALGGVAHMVNFMGSDTVGALQHARTYYDEDMAAFSIPAAEHSTITSWGRENEIDAFANMITQFGGPDKLVAVVSDSYDIYKATEQYWGKDLKDKVASMGGTLVVRPDSGDPTIVPIEIVELLGEAFGYTVNDKGYKVLAPCVRVIQGDGVNPVSIELILERLETKGWSAENIAFGMGGALLQRDVHRDTMKWAMKANATKRADDPVWYDVFKDPITDKEKISKRGIQSLIKTAAGYQSVRRDALPKEAKDLLEPVWENGKLLRDQSFADIRELSEII